MPLKKLKELLSRTPFEALVIYLSDGRHIVIEHPELAILAKDAVHIFKKAETPEEGEVATTVQIVSYLHIVSAEHLSDKAA